MKGAHLEIQSDWDVARLHSAWADGVDNRFLLGRLAELPAETVAHGAAGPVLEIGASEAIHSCKLARRGFDVVALDPSPSMLRRARRRMAEHGVRITLVRGIAEALPFPAGTFDRILCDSAIDHFARPESAVAEMARVLRPDGRLVIGFVNYGGVTARTSRALYSVARATRLASRNTHFFWDTPVPLEHTFECTCALLSRLCSPYLVRERAFGVSIGWMFPGWRLLLARLPTGHARRLLAALDRLAYRAPRLADYVFSVWRPREPRSERRPATVPLYPRTTEVTYPGRAQQEAAHWTRFDLDSALIPLLKANERFSNVLYTGDPALSWLDDLLRRAPYRTAALLGCTETGEEAAWVRARGSARLDIYDLSPGMIQRVRSRLAAEGLLRSCGVRVRFLCADLNLARLPRNRYDVVWSAGCLHHILDLDHLFAQVARALRRDGLFAFREYVGEPRMQCAPDRLARVNELLRQVPARFRLGGVETVASPPADTLSPFCAIRSQDILPLARRYFDPVHEGPAGAFFPLYLHLDMPAMEREAPGVLARLLQAEQSAVRDGDPMPCIVYAVFRKKPGGAHSDPAAAG